MVKDQHCNSHDVDYDGYCPYCNGCEDNFVAAKTGVTIQHTPVVAVVD